jgi:hypothetical protein
MQVTATAGKFNSFLQQTVSLDTAHRDVKAVKLNFVNVPLHYNRERTHGATLASA